MYCNSKILFNDSLTQEVNSLLRQETPYDTIIDRIENGFTEVVEHDVKYKFQGCTLVAHYKDQNKESQYWRMVLPISSEIRWLVMPELHEIPFVAHPRVIRTIRKVQNSFYWQGLVGGIRAFVEACPIC